MSRTFRVVAALTLLSATVAQPAVSQARPPQGKLTLDQYLDWEDAQSPQLSPDGSQVIYTRRWVDKMNDKWETTLWVMNADGSPRRTISASLPSIRTTPCPPIWTWSAVGCSTLRRASTR